MVRDIVGSIPGWGEDYKGVVVIHTQIHKSFLRRAQHR